MKYLKFERETKDGYQVAFFNTRKKCARNKHLFCNEANVIFMANLECKAINQHNSLPNLYIFYRNDVLSV